MQILLKLPALSFSVHLVPASRCLVFLEKTASGLVQP